MVVDSVRYINEDFFISGNNAGSVCLWSTTKKKPIVIKANAHPLPEGSDAAAQQPWVSAVGALVNSDLVATGSSDGFIRVWKCTQKFIALEPLFEIPVKGVVNEIRITPGGLLVAACGRSHRLGSWATHKAKNQVLVAKLF